MWLRLATVSAVAAVLATVIASAPASADPYPGPSPRDPGSGSSSGSDGGTTAPARRKPNNNRPRTDLSPPSQHTPIVLSCPVVTTASCAPQHSTPPPQEFDPAPAAVIPDPVPPPRIPPWCGLLNFLPNCGGSPPPPRLSTCGPNNDNVPPNCDGTPPPVTCGPNNNNVPPNCDGPPPPPPPPPPPAVTVPASLMLSAKVVPLGRQVQAVGIGCEPGAPVALSAGGVQIGTATADRYGTFKTTVDSSAVGAGQGQITAMCGPTMTASLGVVLVNQVGAGPATMMVLVFFLMFVIFLYGRRFERLSDRD